MSTDPNHQRARLLVVDDDPSHMTALYDTLGDAGYDVTAYTSASQALDALKEQSFDLILTDLKMPEMDGIELLQRAQQTDYHLVGIVMTGHAAVDTAIDAMKAGALDYVLKPFKLSTLEPVIVRALEVRRLRVEIAQLQQSVREHVVELEAANKELETFSYSVSHDLRAPLRAINGFSTILVQSYATQMPSEAQQFLAKIIRNVESMGELIEHLLRFSQLSRQPLSKHEVSVSQLVHEAVDELSKDMPKPIDIKIGHLPDAMADRVLLKQAILNLLTNAFKFTRHKEQPRVEIGFELQGNDRVYFVRDNGAGFDMQRAGNLFRVFHRLHSTREFEGTGVGLSLVQRIVQRHHGRVWADAALDQGATFYFTLPS